MNRIRNILALGGWLLLPLAMGVFSSFFRPGGWYESLNKPALTPPNVVFPVVWTTLYLMMGLAAWLVWRSGPLSRTASALGLFMVQLVLNGLWSLLFFGLQNPFYALFDVVALLVMILVTAVAFSRHSRLAAALMVPYALWVAFATYLNFAFWRLN